MSYFPETFKTNSMCSRSSEWFTGMQRLSSSMFKINFFFLYAGKLCFDSIFGFLPQYRFFKVSLNRS